MASNRHRHSFFLRGHLRELLRELSTFRYGDFELDFGRKVRDLESRAKNAGLNIPSKPTPSSHSLNAAQIVSESLRLAIDFPAAAVGVAWTAVEHELLNAVERLSLAVDSPANYSPYGCIKMLVQSGHLNNNTAELLGQMRQLRNKAVHPAASRSQISPEEAREFIALTEGIINKLKSLEKEK
ncbi:hypothetical protein KFF05_10950 [bacterium SCSIO 12827]|nr:hypothetical protein KFF05_10950 [bacterium SCSIO 12827]